MPRIVLVTLFSIALAACNQQQAPVDSADMQTSEAPDVAGMPEADGPTAKIPSEYGIGTVFVNNLTVNGESSVMTDTLVQKIERDGRTLDVYEQSAPVAEPGGACNGRTHIVLDAETRSWAGCMADGKFLAEVRPHNGRFSWPLQVGKKWRAEPRWVDHVVQPDWSGQYWTEFEVVAYEEVRVPAGNFMAFKVEATASSSGDSYEVIWYAPDVGAFVKGSWGRMENSGYGPLEGAWELVSVEFN